MSTPVRTDSGDFGEADQISDLRRCRPIISGMRRLNLNDIIIVKISTFNLDVDTANSPCRLESDPRTGALAHAMFAKALSCVAKLSATTETAHVISQLSMQGRAALEFKQVRINSLYFVVFESFSVDIYHILDKISSDGSSTTSDESQEDDDLEGHERPTKRARRQGKLPVRKYIQVATVNFLHDIYIELHVDC